MTPPCPPKHTVGEILREHGERYRQLWNPTPLQERVLTALASCRTPALGGFVDACDSCDHRRIRYNPCRNRHCPGCGGLLAAEWVEERRTRTLPVGHYHVVFTIPSELRELVFENARVAYGLLLRSAGHVVVGVGRSNKGVGGQVGVTTVLHTWTRDLSYHPHVHCIVSAGGLSESGDAWLPCPRERYFAPLALLAARFRNALLRALTYAHDHGQLRFAGACKELADPGVFREWRASLQQKPWNAYAKAPFANPSVLFRYLGHYTHRVGISNGRLLEVSDSGVTFRTRDERSVTLDPLVFVGRLLRHVLPKRFVKVRHYGLYASGSSHRFALALALLPPLPECLDEHGHGHAEPPADEEEPSGLALALKRFAAAPQLARSDPARALEETLTQLAALIHWIQVLAPGERVVVHFAERCPVCMFGYLFTEPIDPVA